MKPRKGLLPKYLTSHLTNAKVIFRKFVRQSYIKIAATSFQPLNKIKHIIMIDAAELVDNDFLRQFELKVEDDLAKIEYSLQDRKIFLTKLCIPESITSEEFETNFLTMVFENISDRNISVVPTSPEIAKFLRKNRKYQKMLPVGIRI